MSAAPVQLHLWEAPAELAARLAAFGWSLTWDGAAGWRLDGNGAPAWFRRLKGVDDWLTWQESQRKPRRQRAAAEEMAA